MAWLGVMIALGLACRPALPWPGAPTSTAPPAATLSDPTPSPAQTTPAALPQQNVALGRAATASVALIHEQPGMALDGLEHTQWGSGSHAPQWLEIDLGRPATIEQLRLHVAQYPAGHTLHHIWGRREGETYQLLHEFDEETADGQLLTHQPLPAWTGIRWLKVETVASPSWVSWREIELLGRFEAAGTPPSAITEHVIGVRAGPGGAEFYDRRTGQRFVPRGANFLLKELVNGHYADRLFTPGHYDPAAVAQALAQMQVFGYNTVRVFLDLCDRNCIADPRGGLSGPYLDNVAHFLRLAQDHHLVVLLTSNDLPTSGGYGELLPCCATYDGYLNAHFLSPEGVEIARRYWHDIVTGLLERGAPTEAVLAYQLKNEQFLWRDQPPLSLSSGSLTTANGRTYDLSDPAQKDEMVDDNLRHYIRQVRSAIVALDPTALVTMGFFAPDSPHAWRAGDTRLVRTAPLLQQSDLDFFDFHAYPGVELSLAQTVENFGLSGDSGKPVLLGEFGGFHFADPSPLAAANTLVNWQVESCAFGFDGWLHWLWAERDDEVWGGAEARSAINSALAPATRPDACAPGVFARRNLALGQPGNASATVGRDAPSKAFDGLAHTQWSSGSPPSQWVEVDLGRANAVAELQLLVAQDPAGLTTNRIWGRGPVGDYQLLAELTGETQDGQWLVYTPETPWTAIRYLRIQTILSPSWVSWREIRVFGP